MPILIHVEPAHEAWAVHCPLFENPMLFRSGARAEGAARDLAQCLADSGQTVVLEIRLRNGGLAGRFLFPSEERRVSNAA